MAVMTNFIPNCEIVLREDPKDWIRTRLGPNVHGNGMVGTSPMTDPETIARFKKSYGADWEPLNSETLHSYWVAYESILRAGGERAGFRNRKEDSRVCLSITESHFLGNFDKGIAVDRDNKTVHKLGAKCSLLFVWPLTEIESITVERKKGALKDSDVGVTIAGAGSVFKSSAIYSYTSYRDRYPRPYPAQSKAQSLGYALADAVNAALDADFEWTEEPASIGWQKFVVEEISFRRAGSKGSTK